ncbi:MAG: hypothetical protein QXN23_02075 [Candidatus Caldarchaeum sp.]|nr:hypothetical protein [Candidatus Caldarchaeales archaeon]
MVKPLFQCLGCKLFDGSLMFFNLLISRTAKTCFLKRPTNAGTFAGATFFAFLTLWLYLKFRNERKLLFVPILAGVGLLAKESTLPVVLSIVLLGLIDKEYRKTIKFTILLAIPAIVWQTYTTLAFGENYITHYLRAGIEYSQTRYSIPFYSDLIDILKALALGHFPSAPLPYSLDL